ncbi:MAG TPA: hypothetical protein VJ577_11130 [Burkholderiaceae bacterium]|nr:hypothetical protein [Burkholderiaceae bacterium]
MDHPDEQPAGINGAPKFGRLLVVLFIAVMLIVAMTFVADAFYS